MRGKERRQGLVTPLSSAIRATRKSAEIPLEEPALTYPESAISLNIIGRLAAATSGTLERPLPLVKQRSDAPRKGSKPGDLPRLRSTVRPASGRTAEIWPSRVRSECG